MPDPQLVGYLRKTVPMYGADAVREKLLEEGVEAAEIDDALAVAIKNEKKKPPVMVYVGFAGVALLAVAGYLAMDKPGTQAASTGRPPAVGEMDAGTGKQSSGHGPYMGRYGYMIKIPEGYLSQSSSKDMDTTEVLYVYRKDTDPQNFLNEGLYGQLGIIRLEVRPRRIPEGTMGMEAVKSGITTTLNGRGDTFTMRDVVIAGLPGFVVNIQQPFPLTQSFVIGSKVLYVLTGGAEDQTYTDTLQSLAEVSPHDTPRDHEGDQ